MINATIGSLKGFNNKPTNNPKYRPTKCQVSVANPFGEGQNQKKQMTTIIKIILLILFMSTSTTHTKVSLTKYSYFSTSTQLQSFIEKAGISHKRSIPALNHPLNLPISNKLQLLKLFFINVGRCTIHDLAPFDSHLRSQ